MSHPLRGYLYIAGATFLWGVAASLGRAAFTGRLLPHGQIVAAIDPIILSQSRTTFSCVLLAGVLVARRGWRGLRVPAADVLRMFLLGVFGVAASNYCYYLAIQRTNVATAIILQYTAPVWVLLYAVARGLQKPTLQRFSAVGLAMAGISLVIGIFGGGFRLDPVGLMAGLLAALSFALYNVGGHRILLRYDRWIVLCYVVLSASVFWIFVNPPAKVVAAHYSSSQWVFLLAFSVISVLAPFALYFAGLQHLEPTRAIIVSCLEPVFSIVIAAATLGEGMRPLQSVGILLVLIAIVIVQMPDQRSREPVTMIEPME
ncbi:MAG: EamA family transporter [Acidobacteriaceae bacterium]|nr:EamA family transporter [Acidobacteriaceae bacterium]